MGEPAVGGKRPASGLSDTFPISASAAGVQRGRKEAPAGRPVVFIVRLPLSLAGAAMAQRSEEHAKSGYIIVEPLYRLFHWGLETTQTMG
jgi:hypothetical protein